MEDSSTGAALTYAARDRDRPFALLCLELRTLVEILVPVFARRTVGEDVLVASPWGDSAVVFDGEDGG